MQVLRCLREYLYTHIQPKNKRLFSVNGWGVQGFFGMQSVKKTSIFLPSLENTFLSKPTPKQTSLFPNTKVKSCRLGSTTVPLRYCEIAPAIGTRPISPF